MAKFGGGEITWEIYWVQYSGLKAWIAVESLKWFSVIDLENDYFLIKFKEESDVANVLANGPWVVLGHYLTVQP